MPPLCTNIVHGNSFQERRTTIIGARVPNIWELDLLLGGDRLMDACFRTDESNKLFRRTIR